MLYYISALKNFLEFPERFRIELPEKQPWMLSSRMLNHNSNLAIIFSTTSLVQQKLFNSYLKKFSSFQVKLPVIETSFYSKVRAFQNQTSKIERAFAEMVNFVLIFKSGDL